MKKTALFLTFAAACSTPPDIDELELEARAPAAPYKASIKTGSLKLTGNGDASKLTLRLRTSTVLDVDVGDDGVADFSFDRSRFASIVIDAGGGDDLVRMDESNGAFTHEESITLIGGGGNDTLIGGVGAELVYGGQGNDVVTGGPGIDAVFLGDGDDTFTWEAGHGSDVLEGEAGEDALIVNGTNASESIDVRASEGRLRFFRDIAGIELDVFGVERVDFNARGGNDTILVGDVAGTGVTRVNVDLSLAAGGADALADVVLVEGTVPISGDATGVYAGVVRVTGGELALDRLMVAGETVTVNGTAGPETLSVYSNLGRALVYAESWNTPADLAPLAKLVVNGLGGDDFIHHTGGTLPFALELNGGEGNDTVLGGAGADVVSGGPGNDTVNGRQSADIVLLGAGDDLTQWNPGDGSDVIEGEGDSDTLQLNGSSANEIIRLDAVNGILQLTRDIAAIRLEVDGVERVDVLARAGTDQVLVGDLSTTPVTAVRVDLSNLGSDDLVADVVAVAGLPVVTGSAASVNAGIVSVVGGSAATDRVLVTAAAGEQIDVNGTEGPDAISVVSVNNEPNVHSEGWNVRVAFTGAGFLSVHGFGGDDHLSSVGNLVGLNLQLDGGEGNDTLLGSNSTDFIVGGPGSDYIDGQQGADVLFGGDDDDVFNWDAGDGSDVIEGEGGLDRMVFNGTSANEDFDVSANGARVRLARNIATVVHDVAGVERLDIPTRLGNDRVFVNDLTGTALTEVNLELAPVGDFIQDIVHVRGTSGPDTIAIEAQPGEVVVSGLAARTRITSPEPTDHLVVEGLGGVDAITPPALGGIIGLTILQD